MKRVKKKVWATGAASFLLASATLALLLGAAPAFAVEQCRFIQAKPEREACYERQAADLAAKRKPEAPRESKTMQSLEQMKHEDEAVNRQLRSICRGC
jgi:predicted outer membrane protein